MCYMNAVAWKLPSFLERMLLGASVLATWPVVECPWVLPQTLEVLKTVQSAAATEHWRWCQCPAFLDRESSQGALSSRTRAQWMWLQLQHKGTSVSVLTPLLLRLMLLLLLLLLPWCR